MENLKKNGIRYVLNKLKSYFVLIADAVKSVNGNLPDSTGDITVTNVPYADNLTSESSQSGEGTFIIRTSGGEMSINDGEAWLMDIQGNRIITGKVNEVLDLQVNSAVEENPITATINRATFVAYVEDSTTITLVYSNAWSADPALYGVNISGTPTAGDSIVITYVKEELGTITQSNPQTFVSTGWNLFNSTLGYARVVKYEYGYRIEGTYTGIAFSSTESGTQSTITPIDGNFDLPSGATDGYIWVTGAGADTIVYATHSDWTAMANDGVYNAYIEYAVNFTSIMENLFPYGLLAVGNVRDEINLNLGTAINRIERVAYTADNLTAARNSGRAYEYDGDYIYIVMAAPVSTGISISGVYTANDHGLEYFTGTTVPVITEFLYGNNLKNKLERDVVTISAQTLTSVQKTQVRANINAASQTDFSALSDSLTPQAQTVSGTLDDGTSYQLRMNKIGNIVIANLSITAADAPSSKFTDSSIVLAGVIPTDWRPTNDYVALVSGRSSGAWASNAYVSVAVRLNANGSAVMLYSTALTTCAYIHGEIVWTH